MKIHSGVGRKFVLASVLATLFTVVLGIAALGQTQNAPPRGTASLQSNIMREVGHQLVNLPTLSVFDDLEYTVNGSEVTLSGQVVDEATKDDAASNVKGIEGVTKVTNKVQLFPVSPFDNQIRRAEFHAIYNDPGLDRYAYGNVAPIHILVSGGHVTLVGTVANQHDKDLAGLRAKGVPNVFTVTNNLRIGGVPKSS